MEILQSSTNFYIKENETLVGQLIYSISEGVLIIHSVVVNPAFRGQGIAAQLVEKSIEYATANNLKIQPICSYAVAYFQKNKKHSNLLV